MDRICEKLDKIVKFSLNFPELTSNVCVIFKAFSALCTRSDGVKFNTKISVTFLEKFAWFHKYYFKLCYDESHVQFMYTNVTTKFLKSNSFEIRTAAAKCFGVIMKYDIDTNVDADEADILSQCRNDMYDFFEKEMMVDSDEIEAEDQAFRIQLYSSLFCASFHLRKPMIFNISKLFCREKYSEDIRRKCFEKILKFLKCEVESLMDNYVLQYMMSNWIAKNFEINKFPYYFFGCLSNEDFLMKNYDMILLSLLKNNYELAEKFVTSSSDSQNQFTMKDGITNVISECFAFTIPIKAGCNEIKYKAKGEELQANINELFMKSEQNVLMSDNLPQIFSKIFANVIDAEKFVQISGLKYDFQPLDESLSMQDFQKCMSYVTIKCRAIDQSFITFLCNNRKKSMEQLLMLLRCRIQSTEMKEHKILYLLQYCILVEQTYDYLKDQAIHRNVGIKEFLIQESVSFYGFLITSKKYGTKLRETAANFFRTYLEEIVPTCIHEFKPQMVRIMPILVKTVQENEISPIKAKCWEIINFLVMQPDLSEEIVKIDRFPVSTEFQEFRNYQRQTKYSTNDFNLSDEIRHFLSVKQRNVEGLKELSDHLANKKTELKILFESIQIEGNDSLLYRLLRVLIETIQQSASTIGDERAVAAVKCLGEIGSHNLSKIVFNADDPAIYQDIESVQHCQVLICHKVLDHMESLLLHSDPKVFEASSYACHHIFSTLSSKGYADRPYLRPFQSSRKSDLHCFYLIPKVDKLFDIDLQKFVEENKTTSYKSWLVSFCVKMMKFAGDKVLSSIPEFPLSLAEAINSQIFQLLVHYDREEVSVELLNAVNFFFFKCQEALNYKEKTNEGSIFIDKKAIRQMLKLAEVIRIFIKNNPSSTMAQISNLNHLHIAKAAKYCDAFFSAIMYCEIWAQSEVESDSERNFKVSINNKVLQDVMYHSYSAIGINDTLDLYLNPFTNRSIYWKNSKQYFQMLIASVNDTNEESAQIFYDLGLYHLMSKFSDTTKDQDKSRQYDCLWRLSKWDDIVDTEQQLKDENGLIDLRGEFNKYHYLGLQCLNNGDEVGTKNAVIQSRKIISQLLSQQSLECTKTLYKFMEMSHRLVQIEDFGEVNLFYCIISQSVIAFLFRFVLDACIIPMRVFLRNGQHMTIYSLTMNFTRKCLRNAAVSLTLRTSNQVVAHGFLRLISQICSSQSSSR